MYAKKGHERGRRAALVDHEPSRECDAGEVEAQRPGGERSLALDADDRQHDGDEAGHHQRCARYVKAACGVPVATLGYD